MTTNITISPADYNLLVELIDPQVDMRKYRFQYDGVTLQVPDAVVGTVQTIMASPTWRASGLQAQLNAYAASARYTREMAGLTVDIGGGVSIALDTSDRSKTLMLGALQMAAANPSTFSISWKTSAGSFTTLNAAQMEAMSFALAAFVQAGYDLELAAHNAIMAGTITTTAQIDTLLRTGG